MMQPQLSFEHAPPVSAPMRFFLTAPLFAIAAGLLVLFSGPDMLSSRWTPAALALTHLIAIGFLLQVMFGALLQLLPVVAGAHMARSTLFSTSVHALITTGTLLLATAFLTNRPALFDFAVALLAPGVLIFALSALRAMDGIVARNPTVRGLTLALLGLVGTAFSGTAMAISLGMSLDFPLVSLANLHMGWGFVAWGCTVLTAVSYVVVPMFQLTPKYPAWLERHFITVAFGLVSLWTTVDLAGWVASAPLLEASVVACGATFAVSTLNIQLRSKRARPDITQHGWRIAMLSVCFACVLWLAAQTIHSLEEWPGWPVLFGILLLFGGFMSVSISMLYKIVPFLLWLNLQNLGPCRATVPNMKKLLPQPLIDGQMRTHFLSYTLLLLAVFWPTLFVYPAGLALVIANCWLLSNLLSATLFYRRHLALT